MGAHGEENFSGITKDLRPDPNNPGEELLGEDLFKNVEAERITPKNNVKMRNIWKMLSYFWKYFILDRFIRIYFL